MRLFAPKIKMKLNCSSSEKIQKPQNDKKSHYSKIVKTMNLKDVIIFIYLPTPPLGEDMTQGQFLNGV